MATIASHQPSPLPRLRRDSPFLPSGQGTVTAMLQLAEVGPGDVVYDLGCGDGRIVIAAAQLGARGVGVEIDPDLLAACRRNARLAGVAERVQFLEQSFFKTDLRDATVVMLYLLPSTNARLRPRLLTQLRPGARIVANNFPLADWPPDATINLSGRPLYLWVVRQSQEMVQ